MRNCLLDSADAPAATGITTFYEVCCVWLRRQVGGTAAAVWSGPQRTEPYCRQDASMIHCFFVFLPNFSSCVLHTPLTYFLSYPLSLHHPSHPRLSPERAGWIMQYSALLIIVIIGLFSGSLFFLLVRHIFHASFPLWPHFFLNHSWLPASPVVLEPAKHYITNVCFRKPLSIYVYMKGTHSNIYALTRLSGPVVCYQHQLWRQCQQKHTLPVRSET